MEEEEVGERKQRGEAGEALEDFETLMFMTKTIYELKYF